MAQPTLRERLGQPIAALSALVLLIIAWQAQRAFDYTQPRASGWIVIAAVVALAAITMNASWRGAAVADVPRRYEWPVVAALCLLGVAFRLVHFYVVPEGMNHDAGWYGQYANEIVRGTAYTPYVAAAWGRETLFMYVVAGFIKIFGNTPEALQAASTLWGIVALLPFYFLARAIFGSGIAALALGFLAVSGWHGVFSRAGWRVITVPPFEMLALLGAWQVGQRGERRDWMLLGAGAAASIYTYNAGRIVPLICAVYVVALLIARRHHWRRIVAGATVAFMTFLVVGAPMLWYAATHFDQFQSRASYLEQERAAHGVWWNWVDAAGLFTHRGNGNDFFINDPLLEPMAAALFLLGIAVALMRWRDRAARFLLVGLVLSVVPGVLAVPNGNRCITALPFAYLFVVLGARSWLGATSGWVDEGRRMTLVAAIATVLLVIGAVESYTEFLGPQRRPLPGFSAAATAAGLAMHHYIDRYKLFTVAGWQENTLTYLAYDGHGSPFEREYVWGHTYSEIDPEISPFGGKGILFMLDLFPEGQDAFAKLVQRFPAHRVEPLLPPRVGNEPLGRLFFVDRHPPNERPAPNAFDGVQGQGPGEFDEPMGAAFDDDGNLYVTERINCRVQKFAPDGTFIRAWGREGDARGEFREPRDVSVDGHNVYIADTWNQRVQVFTVDGDFVRAWRGDPAFMGPRGICARNGRVYLADTGRSIVHVFDANGKRLAIIGEREGDAPGHLIEPADVAVDAADRVYVINSGNNRIEVFDANGAAVGMIQIPGWQGRGAKEAYLTIDAAGALYLTDPETTTIRRFTTSGTELSAIRIPRLDFPSGVAVHGNTVVAGTRRWHTMRGAVIADR